MGLSDRGRSEESVVFFGSKDKNVCALDAATGRRRWAFETRKEQGKMIYTFENIP